MAFTMPHALPKPALAAPDKPAYPLPFGILGFGLHLGSYWLATRVFFGHSGIVAIHPIFAIAIAVCSLLLSAVATCTPTPTPTQYRGMLLWNLSNHLTLCGLITHTAVLTQRGPFTASTMRCELGVWAAPYLLGLVYGICARDGLLELVRDAGYPRGVKWVAAGVAAGCGIVVVPVVGIAASMARLQEGLWVPVMGLAWVGSVAIVAPLGADLAVMVLARRYAWRALPVGEERWRWWGRVGAGVVVWVVM